ncbi:30S ribosome-binding factor RbfA [Candidatus Uabimicrobium amorphum]|uniref:Ribosome-binding factor A n=1 Tax=Uabimicrobium amorphum TaxID=2596890 RepID=A0A5S9IVM3_UABAM|nr:30S ribosome-binding factor RbfA [Candidatus Uabimicrobium amorphum]BBM87385.1 ribosome-binding factor A [Candidatus Uabimicrobium amorphum]
MAKIERLNKRVKELASKIILYRLSDPRIKRITVLRAKFSPDLRYCTVYVSILGSKSQVRTALRGLQHARGYIQRQIAERLSLRYAPTIKIEHDEGLEQQQEMTNIIDKVREEDKEYNPDTEEVEEPISTEGESEESLSDEPQDSGDDPEKS